MTSYLLAGPAEEPVSLAEAKAYLRIDDDAEDGLIGTLIAAARLHVEAVTGKALLDQTWRLVRDGWPAGGEIRLPLAPFRELVAVTAYDRDGEPHAIALAQFRARPDRLVLPARVAGMPTMLRAELGIEIDYVAGHGEAPEDVPADLRQALLVLVAYWHEHRDAVLMAGTGAVVPAGFERLVAMHRRVAL